MPVCRVEARPPNPLCLEGVAWSRGDAGNEDKPPLRLAFADQAWLAAFALANLLPLSFWDRIEAWARGALVLYAGR